MPRDPDFTVRIVDINGNPDSTVAVVDGITDLSPSVGDVLQWNGSAWVAVPADTPGAHAASHAAGGGDAVTLTEAQITSLTADLATLTAADKAITANTQTDDYPLVLTDAGKVVEMNKATAVTLTIPLNATVAFPTGTVLEVFQLGAGQVTVAATGGVTLRAPNGAKTTKQYSTATLRKRGTDEWVVSGDVTP